jgi:serine/threonine protein phosphatase PrpC
VPTEPSGAAAAVDALHELLRRTHLTTPSEVGAVIVEQAEALGGSDAAVYLVDYAQSALVALAPADAPALTVAGTVAGRAFSTTTALATEPDALGLRRLWMPLLDGTERLGVLGLTVHESVLDDRLLGLTERFAHVAAILLVSKSAYGDAIENVRRRQPMTIAAELLWELVPPLVFATDGLAIAGLLEPCYDNGGDAFDYAVNGDTLHLAVFDAMGHGLTAAGVAAFAISAYRHSRRLGSGLVETHAAMHDAVGRQFPDDRFVTALIAELHLGAGTLSWISAGHPPPVLVRDARHTSTLPCRPAPPLGVVPLAVPPQVGRASLEPGDQLLLYTDGLTEARDHDGVPLGIAGLSEFIAREASAGHTAPETLRRLRETVLVREQTDLRDDATALLVEWRRGSEAAFMPQTVL